MNEIFFLSLAEAPGAIENSTSINYKMRTGPVTARGRIQRFTLAGHHARQAPWKGRPLRYFPIFFDLDTRDVLIVGGGEKALQKLRLLSKTSAHLRVVADVISDDVAALAGLPTVRID